MKEEKEQVNEVVKFVEKDFFVSGENSLIPSADIDTLEEFRKYLTSKHVDQVGRHENSSYLLMFFIKLMSAKKN